MVTGNTVSGTSGDGIRVEDGSHYNEINHNTVSKSGGTDLVDLNGQLEGNLYCDENAWMNNTFDTRNVDCIN